MKPSIKNTNRELRIRLHTLKTMRRNLSELLLINPNITVEEVIIILTDNTLEIKKEIIRGLNGGHRKTTIPPIPEMISDVTTT